MEFSAFKIFSDNWWQKYKKSKYDKNVDISFSLCVFKPQKCQKGSTIVPTCLQINIFPAEFYKFPKATLKIYEN